MATGTTMRGRTESPYGGQYIPIADRQQQVAPNGSDFSTTSLVGVNIPNSVISHAGKKSGNVIRITFKTVLANDEKKGEYVYAGVAIDGTFQATSAARLYIVDDDIEGTLIGTLEITLVDALSHDYSIQVFGEGGTVTIFQDLTLIQFTEFEIL